MFLLEYSWQLTKGITSAIEKENIRIHANLQFTKLARWDEQYSWLVGTCYAKLGETDHALDWLENAVNRGFLNYPFLSADDPFLESLRTTVRFQALMKSVAVKWRALDQA